MLDEALIELDSSNNPTYLHHDRKGSIIATSNSSGVVVNTYAYSPFGESGSMSGTTFGYTGQRYDPETGLYYYKNRHYSPELGRFLQPDLIGYGDGLNVYQYGYNDPNMFSDPLGLAADGSRIAGDTSFPVSGGFGYSGGVGGFGGSGGFGISPLGQGSEVAYYAQQWRPDLTWSKTDKSGPTIFFKQNPQAINVEETNFWGIGERVYTFEVFRIAIPFLHSLSEVNSKLPTSTEYIVNYSNDPLSNQFEGHTKQLFKKLYQQVSFGYRILI